MSNKNRHQLLDGMLFNRVRDGYASVLKLITNDFHLEAAILARATIESFLVFIYHINNRKDAWEKLIAQSKYNKEKLINKTLNNGKYQEFLDEARNFDKSKLEGARNISAKEWARLANEIEHYDYSYSLLSDFIHVNIETLEKRLEIKDGEVLGFKQQQNDEFLDMILFTIVDIIIKSMQSLNSEYLDLELTGLDNINESLKEINQL
jgi:hypothetical protein